MDGAVPRFSVDSGSDCKLCHVNPSGSGLCNNYGASIFVPDDLPMQFMAQQTGENPWTGKINSTLRVGGDVRIQQMIYTAGSSFLGFTLIPAYPMGTNLFSITA